MAGYKISGRAVPVMGLTESKQLYVCERTLKDILLADNIKNLPVVVVSIAGAFRTGKSFMLNFLLRYLRSGCKTDWLGNPTAPLEGFHWSRGSDPDTKGIMMWNEVFQVTTPSREKLAVVVMDTQGAFDGKSTRGEIAAFFAVAAMLSSVLIYNVSGNLREDHLETLNFFTHYAQLAKNVRGKPFQRLMFLVRDWNFPSETPYGKDGGWSIIKKLLYELSGKPAEVQEQHKAIDDSFDSIECFLMPHPGIQVIKKKQFYGSLEDLDDDFKTQLNSLVDLLLAPENLLVKKTNKKKTTCQELHMLLREYGRTFSDGRLPTPQSLLEANARQDHEKAIQKAMDYYDRIMKRGVRKDCPLKDKELYSYDQEAVQSALQAFEETPKLGTSALSAEYRSKLKKNLPFINWSNTGNIKVIYAKSGFRARTPTDTMPKMIQSVSVELKKTFLKYSRMNEMFAAYAAMKRNTKVTIATCALTAGVSLAGIAAPPALIAAVPCACVSVTTGILAARDNKKYQKIRTELALSDHEERTNTEE